MFRELGAYLDSIKARDPAPQVALGSAALSRLYWRSACIELRIGCSRVNFISLLA